MIRRLLTFCLLAAPLTAAAQDPVDIGVIKESDVVVVQKLLYPKQGRSELGIEFGLMPWDAYTITPTLSLSVDVHRSESFSIGAVLTGGYGPKSHTYRELKTIHGVAPYAFRYVGSALGGVGWSPIYAKMNVGGTRIFHFDVYFVGRGGITVESSLIPLGGTPISPTLSAGAGSRIFLGDRSTLRVEIRDDLLLQRRSLTSSWHLNQNAMILVGFTQLSKVKQ